MHRSFVLSDGPEIAFAPAGDGTASAEQPPIARSFSEAKATAIAQFERAYVTELLRRTKGNISLAARLCGKERSRLTKLVKKYGLERHDFTRS